MFILIKIQNIEFLAKIMFYTIYKKGLIHGVSYNSWFIWDYIEHSLCFVKRIKNKEWNIANSRFKGKIYIIDVIY